MSAAGSTPSNIALSAGRIGSLELRNRFIKVATYEGMTPGGLPSQQLSDFHADTVAGGVAMTTVSYAAVHGNGRTFSEQLLLSKDAVPGLRQLTDAVHKLGGAASVQLAHCGGFSKNKKIVGRGPLGPSFLPNHYGLMYGMPFIKAMRGGEFEEATAAYEGAVGLCREAGFDALELHMGHGYLLSQFLSPALNRRRDEHGGSLDNRMRFPLEVLRRVKAAAGPDMPVLVKLNLDDGVRGGLHIDEAVEIAKAVAAEGADALVPSGSLVQMSAFYLMRGEVPLKSMVEVEKNPAQKLAMRIFAPLAMRGQDYSTNYFIDDAKRMVDAVDIPVVLQGGVDSADAVDQAMDSGFEFVAMGRALLSDPDFVTRLGAGERVQARCNHCNECMAEMDRGGVRCVL